MAKQTDVKTNAMRILDKMKIEYKMYAYECDEFVDGMETARKLDLPPEKVYKTLVTQANTKEYLVFVIPIEAELDLKQAAKVSNVKSLTMLPLKDVTPVTGYVRGGCTAIGMKKQFRTFLEEDAVLLDEMYVSAGKIGVQMCLRPVDFRAVTKAEVGTLKK